MAAPPPPFPPTLAPPPVPEGWRADWSAEYNTWFYVNLSTQQSQWVNPLGQPQPPLSPPQYGTGETFAPQYTPPGDQYSPQAGILGQQTTPPADSDRGLGKIGGGFLGVAGGLLAGALVSHEIDERKNHHKPGFKFWNEHSSGGGGGGLLSGLGRGGPGGLFSSFGGAAGATGGSGASGASGAAGGGMFSNVGSYMPFGNAGGGPPLHIHCAAYADLDVTQQVRRMVTGGDTFNLNTDEIGGVFGDPWPGNRKQFSILYSYGQRPWELVASADRDGMLSLIPHQALDTERMKFVQDGRSRVIAVVWGTGNGLENGKGPATKLQEIESSGEFPATNSWMGFDGMCGPAKTAIVYYRTNHGGVAMTAARENMTVRMPWNPLAKWT